MLQQSSITSVTSVVDNLPGVSIQEGDAYGFDDWSSNVVVRGFQVTISEAQIGTTIDGFPNGTSDYFSGAKANRFVDPMNLGGVEVSQGTADIASRSVEALGGTFDYLTDDPAAERTCTASITNGENDGSRFSMRLDTGPLFGREARAWIAAVRQEATDWVQGSARNEREHVAAKLVSSHGRLGSHHLPLPRQHPRGHLPAASTARPTSGPTRAGTASSATGPGSRISTSSTDRGWQTRRDNTLAYLQGGLGLQRGRLAAGRRLPPPQPGPRRLAASPTSSTSSTTPAVRSRSWRVSTRCRAATQTRPDPLRRPRQGCRRRSCSPGAPLPIIHNYYGSGWPGGRPCVPPGARRRCSRTATATTARTASA